ncbi:MAG: translocase [Epsilonproteobacteria bacterium (ex Lamellibrachia satsuma)]|nr:MAG: translocase [Epsilonproteobacteria bacterium (ex Lamellibrachia satsuma)]
MFGIGFTEILLISIIAILFLGPDKLPEAMIQIAKFIKGVKKTIGEAKSSLEEEMKIADLKEEALNYKQQLDSATNELKSFKNIDFDDMQDILDHEERITTKPIKKESPYAESATTPVEPKNDTVTFKKKPKKKTKKDLKSKDDTKGDA